MQARLAQLGALLGKGLAPIYLLHGDEPLLLFEAADTLRAAARRAGFEDRQVLVAESGFKWDEFAAAHQNLSLFGGRGLIDLRLPTGKPGVEGARQLEAYAGAPSPDHVLLISCPRLDRATQQSKWFGALEAAGVSVAIAVLEREELPAWIGARLTARGQKARPETLQMLADRCEGNLLAAQQEIEKLALLLPPGELAPEAVENAVARVARYDITQMSEAVLLGDVARFCKVLAGLEAEGEGAPLVVWQLSDDLHALCNVVAAARGGMPLAQAVKNARVWGRRQAAMEAAARRIEPALLGALISEAARLDALAKGLGKDEVWGALRNFGLQLAGAGRAVLRPLAG
ncbi:MAG: DNA polymerase III subunit delta [Betaproteobacteria bacterium]|nr:DNA polymerase III subunit delta [Betaproteobacteria bacterium]